MGYRVTAMFDGDGVGRTTPDALEALTESIAILRREDWPYITDDAGRILSLARMLRLARAEAGDPAGQQRLAGLLADYFEAASGIAFRIASERYVELNSEEHDAELRSLESLGQPVTDLRQRDAEENRRISSILFGQGAWREAGRRWGWLFGSGVAELVPAELAARLGDRFSEPELSAGVREGLAALAEWRRRGRVPRAPRSSGSPPPGPDGHRPRGRSR